MGALMKNKDWLIMLIYDLDGSTYTIKICKDGYVYDNRTHNTMKKLLVLKQKTIDLLENLINEYKDTDLINNLASNCIIKCNLNTKFVCNCKEFEDKIFKLVFKADNIKHPTELLDEIIALIEELRASGELVEMFQADDRDAVVEKLITIACINNQVEG